MNTFSINSTQSLFTRFAWKEYRMLRGFWLAGFVIAFVLQWFVATVASIPGTQEMEVFTIAWAAAALYVVGAAITMFCAETEERTRDYLRLLPGDWRPIFATKIGMSVASALLLACALSLTGWWLADYRWPEPHQMQLTFAVLGVAALEGLAWGLLFSMWWKQPLLAAVAAIALASLGSQIAILGTTSANDAFSLEAYRNALPGRLLICAAVLFLDVLLGSQWLYPRRKQTVWSSNRTTAINLPKSNTHTATAKAFWPRRKMFARLLWQTWRESWKPILMAVPLSLVLMGVVLFPAYMRSRDLFFTSLPFVALFPPALLGALVFRADQQRDHRLFLATHAAWPRYAWLARHTVWFTIVLLLGLATQYAGRWILQAILNTELAHYLDGGGGYRSFDILGTDHLHRPSQWTLSWHLQNVEIMTRAGILTAWAAFVAAYGAGQLFSMLLKQSLLSGFLAILFALIVAAWSVLMFLWGMNPLWFVLPMGLTTLTATWLHTPTWILGKTSPRYWLTPALVLSLPLIAMVLMVPPIRMAQVDQPVPDYPFLNESLEASLQRFREQQKRQEETQRKLEQLAITSFPMIEEVTLDGKKLEDFEFELDERAAELFRANNKELLKPSDREVLERFERGRQDLFYQQNKAAIPAALELLNQSNVTISERDPYYSTQFERTIRDLGILLVVDAERLIERDRLDKAWKRLLAVVPISPNPFFDESPRFYKAILRWAQHSDQTSERLKSAMVELEGRFSLIATPRNRILADHEYVRKVLMDIELPRNYGNQYALMLNNLPGEQSRALVALDLLTAQALNYVDAVVALSNGGSLGFAFQHMNNPRELLRLAPSTTIYANNELAFRGNKADASAANNLTESAATSFFAAEQFSNRTNFNGLLIRWIAAETQRRATLVQLALLAYQLDHGEYPETLVELTPEYLKWPVDDPFSARSFQYRPKGLEHLLRAFPRDIPSGTPLIWSVGYGNVRLNEVVPYERMMGSYDESQMLTPEHEQAMREARQPYFTLEKTEEGRNYYNHWSEFVFPLPTIEADESETSPQPDRNADPGEADRGP